MLGQRAQTAVYGDMAIARTYSDPSKFTSVVDAFLAQMRGYDGGKRISGLKRLVVVDTQVLIIHGEFHPADVRDRRAAEAVLAELRGRYPENATPLDGLRVTLKRQPAPY